MEVDHNAPAVVRAETVVAEPPDAVWRLISDIDSWPAWNPDVRSARLEGELAPGSTFRWKAGPGTIVSTLRSVEPEREIGWSGRTMGIDALHVYRLEPVGDGTRVVSEESWAGLPVRLLRARMRRTLERSLRTGLEHLEAAARR